MSMDAWGRHEAGQGFRIWGLESGGLVEVGRPGHPERAILDVPGGQSLDVPGGQSGRFLSPWYRAGHASWVEGSGGSLMAGPAEHRLGLIP